MFTITDYLDQLDIDKDTLYNAIINAGIEAEQTDTFTVLTPKVTKLVSDTITLLDQINGEVI